MPATADITHSGIYRIRNAINGRAYYGSSVNMRKRWCRHRTDLRTGKHHSRYLQRAFMKYGESAFIFEPMAYCDVAHLIPLEQVFLDRNKGGYNVGVAADSPNRGLRWAPRTSCTCKTCGRKFSVKTSSLRGSNRGMFCSWQCQYKGFKRRPPTIITRTCNRCGKTFSRALGRFNPNVGLYCSKQCGYSGLTDSIVSDILTRYTAGETKASLARFADVDERTIKLIVDGRTWRHIPRPTGIESMRAGKSGNSLLTEQQVMHIRQAYAAGGVTLKALGTHFGVSWGAIQSIVTGTTWKHLPCPPLPPAGERISASRRGKTAPPGTGKKIGDALRGKKRPGVLEKSWATRRRNKLAHLKPTE